VARFYADSGNWQGALLRYQSAYLLAPQDEDAAYGLAEAERRTGQAGKAREHYQALLTLNPDSRHAGAARRALRELEDGSRPHP
jgi:tetratricopeptide (TPR) repeat protein